MNISAQRLPALGLIFLIACATTLAHAQVTHHEAQGNLQTLHRLDCIALDDVKPTYTPADLYPAVATCIEKGEMERAVDLFALAGAFGRFDALRVADRTAHQAVSALQLLVHQRLRDDQRKSFMEALQREVNDPAAVSRRCREIKRIGSPQYRPGYMIEHGMAAFMGKSDNDLVPDFDASAAWSKVRADYLKCADAGS